MSVVLVRVDDRLLHGQVMEAWVPFCRATCIIVASDSASHDPVQRIALESCATREVAIEVEDLRGAVEDIKSGRLDGERVIVVMANLQDAMRTYSEGLIFTSINIGNIHHNGRCRMVTPSVYLDTADEEVLLRFKGLGIEVDIRAVPWDKKTVDYTKQI